MARSVLMTDSSPAMTISGASTSTSSAMYGSIHSLVTHLDHGSKEDTREQPRSSLVPHGTPNGTLNSITPAQQRKPRSKYKHVYAPHDKIRPSVLSHDSVEVPSFVGFRNLLVLTTIVMNLRLVVENARKYGLLISLKSNIPVWDLQLGFLLYLITPAWLFTAYAIEKAAMERAKGVIGRKKKGEDKETPETEQERKAFRNTWILIAFAHTTNILLAFTVTSAIVYWAIDNPAIACLSELHMIIVGMKTCSYAFTNRDLRHAMLHPGTYGNIIPEIYSTHPYPKNITLKNLCYFWWAPTLVYQPDYPRTKTIRWSFVMKRFGETIALSVFIWITCAQYAEPVLRNSLPGMAEMNFISTSERLMKLSTISLIVWLAGFFALFQSFLNMLAELLRFGDREFYGDWWNSTSFREYWSSWNKPVYHFMRRHVHSPLVGRGWHPQAAATAVFVVSGVLHELAVGIPTKSVLGCAFFGMVFQLPLIYTTEPLQKTKNLTLKTLGNCLFWLIFVFCGQPAAAMIYFFSWQSKFGVLAK